MMPERFFFYGTLVAGSGNAVARAVHGRLGNGRAATVAGRLFAICDPGGWYPALVAGAGVVRGWVYEAGAGFGPDDLALIDGYEAYDPARPGTSDYLRQKVLATLADGSLASVQAYVWAQDLPATAVAIAGGDFAAFLRERGVAGFAPGK